MLKTMDPDFINWVKSQLDEQAAKTKRILTALYIFSPILVEKIGNGLRGVSLSQSWCFHLFSLYPSPLLCLYGTAKIGHLLQLDFSYSIKYDWVSLDEISPNMQLAVIAAEDQNSPPLGF